MEPNTGTESRNVDVMSVKNINDRLASSIDAIADLKVGKLGGENG